MNNPLEEITAKRPTNYSQWHRRTLPKWCYMTDGDWFEQRIRNGELQAVAYIETMQVPNVKDAHINYKPWTSKQKLCQEIQEKMHIPAYYVWHNLECTDFLVLKTDETTPKRMTEKQYVLFLKTL